MKGARRLPTLVLALALQGSGALAGEPVEAADTAEVYIYAKEAGNEALLEHLSDPESYEAMAEARREADLPRRENIEMEAVEVERVDGTRAVARATYRPKHGGPSSHEEVHLIRREGRWQVTTKPEPDAP